jgi:hypothetical protein
LLGWLRAKAGRDGQSRDFYVRQLKDWKGSAEICSYLGGGRSFDHAILEFSRAYAKQNQLDYDELVRVVKSGRITAETGSESRVIRTSTRQRSGGSWRRC